MVIDGVLQATMGGQTRSLIAPDPVVPSNDDVPTTAQFEFDDEFQARIAALTLRDFKFVRRTDGLIQPTYFDKEPRALLVAMAQDYWRKYRRLPGSLAVLVQVVKDGFVERRISEEMRRLTIEEMRNLIKLPLSDADYIADKVGEFARHQAIQDAYMRSLDLIEKRQFDKAQKLMEVAFRVGAMDDFEDLDYWNTVERRTQYRKDKAAGLIPKRGITTGIRKLDSLLYHDGWGRQELSVLMGGAKKGKSTGLGFFALKAAQAGYNALYVTLEVSSDIIADRMDACVSEVKMSELETRPHDVQTQVDMRAAAEGRGELRINQFPSGSLTPSKLRRLIEFYKAEGLKFDLVVVDYADIMRPDMVTSDAIENSKNVWLDLRAIAFEEDAAVLTATQTNRDGFKHETAKAEDVAEDFNKIRIADIVISINRTDEEKSQGLARLYLAASRNQAGEYTISIKQDLETMRFITGVVGVS